MLTPPPFRGSRTSTRLELRSLERGDQVALHSYRSLDEVCRYIYSEPLTLDEVATRLEGPWSKSHVEAPGQGLTLGVQRRVEGDLVGDVLLQWVSDRDRSGEIGWVFSPAVRGRGYATEAAHRLLHVAFDEWALHRVVARVDARNEASLRLCERLGLREEARLLDNEWFKGSWSSEVDFALLDEEWREWHRRSDVDRVACPPPEPS